MKTLKFKTNLKCSNCVAKISASLDQTREIKSWSVDLKSPERILTVEAENAEAAALVSKILTDAGYRSEPCGE